MRLKRTNLPRASFVGVFTSIGYKTLLDRQFECISIGDRGKRYKTGYEIAEEEKAKSQYEEKKDR